MTTPRRALGIAICFAAIIALTPVASSFTWWVWICTDDPWCQIPWSWKTSFVFLKFDAAALPVGSPQASAFETAIADWNNVPATSLGFLVDYQVGLDPWNHVDGINSVAYLFDNCNDWKGTTWLRIDETAPDIVETDIWINGNCDLPAQAPNQETDHTATPVTSVRRLALQLLGFAMGLGHERTDVAAMNNGDMFERLLADDKDGKRFLYGFGGVITDLSVTNVVDDIPEPIGGSQVFPPFNQAYPDHGATFMRYVQEPATEYKVAPGDSIDIEYTLLNMGNTIEPNFDVGFEFEHRTDGDSHTIDVVPGGLAGGASDTRIAFQTQIPQIPDGLYDLFVKADNWNEVPEIDESNNRLKHPYQRFAIHPLPPENLNATTGADPSENWAAIVFLTWTRPAANDLRFKHHSIFRRLESEQDYPTTPLVNMPIFNFYKDTDVVHLEDYCYVMTAVNTDDLESERSNEVCIEASRAPLPPTLESAIPSKNWVDLTWTCDPVEDPTLVRYSIYRSLVQGGPYSFLGQVLTDSDGDGLIDCTYRDQNVEYTTTYHYVVTAMNQYGESDYSNEKSATTLPISLPANLTAFSGSEGVFLNWLDNPEPDIGSYNVYRDTGPTGTFLIIGSSLTSDYLDVAVVSGTTYSYRVTALDQEFTPNESDPSTPVIITYIDAPPAIPRNLTAERQVGSVLLDWSDNLEPDFNHFRVHRSTAAGGPYSLLQDNVTESTYSDASAVPGTIYYYVVTALDTSANESAYSDEVSEKSTSLSEPQNLVATPGIENISLDWDDHPGGPDVHFNVYRAEVSGGLYDAPLTVTTSDYFDESVVGGVTYYYIVTAFDSATPSDESNDSSEASATPSLLSPPTGLTASGAADQITLDWNDHPAGPAVHYRIHRSDQSGGPYSQIATPPTSDYVDGSVVTGSRYFYVVQAFDSARPTTQSGFSNEATARAVSLTPPTGLIATPGVNEITLDWSDHPTGPTAHYNVSRSTAQGGPYTFLAATATSDYVDAGLPVAVTHYYVVTAFDSNNPADESDPSAEASAHASSLEPPTGLSVNRREIPFTLDWDDHPAGSSVRYKVWYRWSNPGHALLKWTPYSFLMPYYTVPGKLYRYSVSAVNSDIPGDESARSEELLVKTTSYGAPTNLHVVSRNPGLTLRWNGDLEDEAWDGRWGYFRVLRSLTSGGPYEEVALTKNLEYRVTGIEDTGINYHYVVTAHDRINPADESDLSNEVSGAMTSMQPLTITFAQRYTDRIGIGWTAYNPNVFTLGYRVYRSEDRFGTYELLDTVNNVAGQSSISYNDYSIVPGHSYYYVVTVYRTNNPGDESEFSNVANPDVRIFPHVEDMWMEPPPTLTITLSTGSVEAGQPFTLTLDGTSTIGIVRMWWFVERADGTSGDIPGTVDGVPVNLGIAHDWTACEIGPLQCSYSRILIIDDPDTYVIKANVREVYYGQGGKQAVRLAQAIIENRPPEMGSMADESTYTGETLATTVPATDPDGDVLIFSGTDMPSGSTLDAATGAFQWTPSMFDKPPHHNGVHVVTFSVSDGQLQDSGALQITVPNRPPDLDPIGDRVVPRSQLLYVLVTASDVDGDEIVQYRAEGLPAGAQMKPISEYIAWVSEQNRVIGDLPPNVALSLPPGIPPDTPLDTQLFTWTPTPQQRGDHTIDFYAGDGDLEDNETVVITVENH